MNLAEAFQSAFARGLDVRPRLVLEPTERSFCDEFRPLAGLAGSRAALAAARSGDVKLADKLEVWWLNTWGPRPAVERFTNDTRKELRAMAVHRNFGPRGESAIEWGLVKPCPRCGRKVVAEKHCRFCGGRGHVSEDWEVIYTDMNGDQLEAS